MLGLLQILGGLALFLFGINMLSTGMEKLTGEQIQKWADVIFTETLRCLERISDHADNLGVSVSRS